MLRMTICLIAALQVVTSEPPMHCRQPFPGGANPKECCEFPMVFNMDDLTECGVDMSMAKRQSDCTAHMCLFKKYNLMKDDEKIDREAIAAFFDKWLESNSDYKDVIENTKKNCLKEVLPGPADICEPTKVIFCSLGTLFMNCPTWKDSDDCNKLKDHISECKPYYE